MAKILLVDDEERMNEYMRAYLAKRGFKVSIALSGAEALKTYPEVNPDIILLDLGLPDMNGRDVLKAIKSQNLRITIIVISAYKDQGTKDELFGMGADYFLGKPFAPSELHALLQGIPDTGKGTGG